MRIISRLLSKTTIHHLTLKLYQSIIGRATLTLLITMSHGNSCSQTAQAAFHSQSKSNIEDRTCQGIIPPIDEKRKTFLLEQGVTIEPIEPLGARATGLDVKTIKRKAENEHIFEALENEMANRGFLVFPNLGVMAPDEQINASILWGGREMHSTHGVHPATPGRNRDIMRMSNDPEYGILGVGPQWHNDGSFVEGTFSHAGYHIVRVPENGGGTIFCHQGAAFDMLPPEKQERWSRLISVNSNSGVLHPVVHEHSISGRKSIWLHLGMTGAVIEYLGERKETNGRYRLLNQLEMKDLFQEYNNIMNDGLEKGYAIKYEYNPGDLVMIDNLAIGHKATPQAHGSPTKQGLRVMHRTTVKAEKQFQPGFGLPQALDIYGPNPFGDTGVWIGGGIGFRWDDSIRYQN